MSLLQEMERHGLADCAYNRMLLKENPPYIVCYHDKSGEQCTVHFEKLRKAQDFAYRYNGVILHDGAIIQQSL